MFMEYNGCGVALKEHCGTWVGSSPDGMVRAGLLLQEHGFEFICSGIKADFYGTVAVVSFT